MYSRCTLHYQSVGRASTLSWTLARQISTCTTPVENTATLAKATRQKFALSLHTYACTNQPFARQHSCSNYKGAINSICVQADPMFEFAVLFTRAV